MSVSRSAGPTNRATGAGNEEVARAVVVLGLAAVAIVHLVQVGDTFDESPWLAVAFILLSVACLVLAAQLLHRPTRAVWLQVAVLNAMIIVGFVFTRVVSTRFDDGDVGNWSETLAVASVLTEGFLVLLSVYAVIELSRSRTVSVADRRRDARVTASF